MLGVDCSSLHRFVTLPCMRHRTSIPMLPTLRPHIPCMVSTHSSQGSRSKEPLSDSNRHSPQIHKRVSCLVRPSGFLSRAHVASVYASSDFHPRLMSDGNVTTSDKASVQFALPCRTTSDQCTDLWLFLSRLAKRPLVLYFNTAEEI